MLLHCLKHQSNAPAIVGRMVKRPSEEALRASLDQGIIGEHVSFRLGQSGNAVRVLRDVGRVLPLDRSLAQNDLTESGIRGVDDASTQDRKVIDGALPGGLELRKINAVGEAVDRSHHVCTRLGR